MNLLTFITALNVATIASSYTLNPCPLTNNKVTTFTRYPRRHHNIPTLLSMSETPVVEEDDEEVEPGKMRVSEIKAELDMRGVAYSDCFDKESLVTRLESARSGGRADPSILDEFNKMKLEANISGKSDEIPDKLDDILGGDGNLPGGMSPEMLKKLMSNPELMVLLQSVKMQEVMKLMMTGGQGALEKAMQEDEEVKDIVMKLNEVMSSAM